MLELWSDPVAWLQDPLFWWFPVGASLVSMGAFLLFALPMTWVAWKQPAWALPYRIQDRPAPVSRDVGRGLRQWLLNNVVLSVLVLAGWPLIALSGVHTGPLPPLWVGVAQLVFFVVFDDFLFYWMHRTLHQGWLYKHIHSLHHRVVTPCAATGHYMHPVEYVLTASLMLVGPLLLGAHVVVLYAWVVIRQWEAAEGHSGFSFPWSPTNRLPLFDGPDHHDFHHKRFKGNFAGFLPWTDRVFGTEVADYAAHRGRVPPAAS